MTDFSNRPKMEDIFPYIEASIKDGGQFVLMVMQNLFGVKKGIFVSNIIFVITEVLLVTAGVFLFFKTGNFTLILTVIHLLFLSIFAK